LIVEVILFLISFGFGYLVSFFAQDEILDSKKYLKEVLFLIQAYMVYFASGELFFAFSFYLLFRILEDKAFIFGIFIAILLLFQDYLAVIIALVYSFILGLYDFKKNNWKHYLFLFILKLVLIFTLKNTIF
jgi:hypothetical protein